MARKEKEDKSESVIIDTSKLKTPGDILSYINDKSKVTVGSSGSRLESPEYKSAITYSTGIMSLDQYLGCGGLMAGRIMNAWGWQGTGKTLTGMMIGGHVQRQGGKFALLDAEGTMSPSLARAVGVNVDDLLLFQSTPEKVLSGEDYFDIMKMLVQCGVEFILVDSIPALIPSNKMVSRLGEGQKATSANLISEGLSSITPMLGAFRKSVLYLINQMRARPMAMFGPPAEHTGGNAIKFFETYSLEVKKDTDIVAKVPNPIGMYEERRIGARVECKLHKNKTMSIPTGKINFTVYFETITAQDGTVYSAGVDVVDDAVATGLHAGIIQTNGSWVSWNGIKAQGEEKFKEAFRAALATDPGLFYILRNKVLGISDPPTE